VSVRRARGLLIVAECALAIVLLAGAGLLLRSLDRLRSVEPGFDPANVLSTRVVFPSQPTLPERAGGPEGDAERAASRAQLMQNLITRVEALPGVEDAGFIDDMFTGRQGNKSITIPGRPEAATTGELNDGSVTAGFFSAMHVPLLQGRALTPADLSTKIRALWSPVNTTGTLAEKEQRAVAEPVIVNAAFVHRFFPTDNPIGKRFCIDPANKTYWYEIVGVVGSMRRRGLEYEPVPEYFGEFIPAVSGRGDFFVRTRGNPLAIASSVREAVSQEIPGAVVMGISTADRQLDDLHAQRDFQTWLLAVFASFALALTAVGIYGVVHYSVAERTREIGVRMALGATGADVMRMVLDQGMRMPAAGIAIGLGGALATTRLLSHYLFGISATDPLTFAGVALALSLVAAAACLFPAHRATKIDPVQALRK
jgi:predicted permease